MHKKFMPFFRGILRFRISNQIENDICEVCAESCLRFIVLAARVAQNIGFK